MTERAEAPADDREVRCTRVLDALGRCNRLLARDLIGEVELKCGRCGLVKVYRRNLLTADRRACDH